MSPVVQLESGHALTMAGSATALAHSHVAIGSCVAFVVAGATMNIAPVGVHAATTARDSPGAMATAELAILRRLPRLLCLLLLRTLDFLDLLAGVLDLLLATEFIEALCLVEVAGDSFSGEIAVGERIA